MRRKPLFIVVCLGAMIFWRIGQAQPSETKDSLPRTYTGPADFFRKSDTKRDTLETTYAVKAAMPRVEYYKLAPGNKENMPAGFYAQFVPPLPDTVKVYEGGTEEFFTIGTPAKKEVIYGDSIAILFEVERRRALYADKPMPVKKKGKTTGMITRSGFIPSQGFGTNRYRFAVKPSKFKIAPGALIQASVHVLGTEKNMGTILCSVTRIDYENNTFYVETSNEVPVGEHINWIIMNFPEE